MYDENPNVATTGLAFNQFQQMMETTDDQINLSNNKIRVFPTFQRNYNAKPKSENTSVYNTRPKRQSRISHIESLDSFSSEYDKESGKSSKSGKSVHTVSDIAKGLLQEEIIGEKTKLLMKTLIEQRGELLHDKCLEDAEDLEIKKSNFGLILEKKLSSQGRFITFSFRW